jgi:hypothetical protein
MDERIEKWLYDIIPDIQKRIVLKAETLKYVIANRDNRVLLRKCSIFVFFAFCLLRLFFVSVPVAAHELIYTAGSIH